ncbi:MAG: UDP-glucose/GDP-mannose dehydrogenase family protein [Terrimicrobiaceae bacterium]
MRVTVFGSGYVGLVTGVCLAEAGNHVLCVDIDPAKVDRLKQGSVPIYEPGLDELVRRSLSVGRLNFSTSAEEGVQHGLFQFIAVGTPPDKDGAADISHVLAVAESIGRFMKEYRVVVTKSTVPVGTADKVRATVLATIIEKVRLGIGSDPRIGYGFIYPGCGYGGSCFPKDVQALIRSAHEHGFEARLLSAVQEVNYHQKQTLYRKIQSFFGDRLASCTIALWGLAFKPDTDDVREAPSIALIHALCGAGARVRAYDPVAGEEARKIAGIKEGFEVVENAEDVLRGADALAIVTEWREFRSPDFERIKELLKRPVIFDGRNLYDPDFVKREGFQYFAIGRGDRVEPSRENAG